MTNSEVIARIRHVDRLTAWAYGMASNEIKGEVRVTLLHNEGEELSIQGLRRRTVSLGYVVVEINGPRGRIEVNFKQTVKEKKRFLRSILYANMGM